MNYDLSEVSETLLKSSNFLFVKSFPCSAVVDSKCSIFLYVQILKRCNLNSQTSNYYLLKFSSKYSLLCIYFFLSENFISFFQKRKYKIIKRKKKESDLKLNIVIHNEITHCLYSLSI